MSGRGILDADMTTLGRHLADGLRWWRDELVAMIPASWARPAAGRGARATFDGARLAGARSGRAATIVLDPGLCLIRTIDRPAMNARDLARMLDLEGGRLFPMPPAALVIAGKAIARAGPTITIAVAALPIVRAEALAREVGAAGATPAAVVSGGQEAIDLLPALHRAGLFDRRASAARLWWTIVASLFLANVALLVWRDSARVSRLEEIVAAQRPAAAAARSIATRITAGQRMARATNFARIRHDPSGVLTRVAAALPPGTWVQRYGWTGDTLKLAGYRPRDADVVRALRGLPGFLEVRNTSIDTVAEVPAGQPFDVTARLQGGAR